DNASGAQASAPLTINPIVADVSGAVYYWDLGEGKMQRIDATGRHPAIPNPPVDPSPMRPGNRCVACHAVSKDGRYLAATLWGAGFGPGSVFDLSNPAIQTADPAPTLVPPGTYNALFSTFNPDATRLLVSTGNALSLLDPKTGMPVPTLGAP